MAAIDARPVSSWNTSAKVRLSPDGESLVWTGPFNRLVERPADDVRLAQQFIGLARPGSDIGSFRSFGETFGPLHLCEHGLPRTHIDVRQREFLPNDLVDAHFVPTSWGRSTIAEPLAAWTSLARQAHAMAYIADGLRDGEGAGSAVWAPLLPLLPDLTTVQGHAFDPSNEPLAVQQRALAHCIETWIQWGRIRLTVTWSEGNSRPEARNGATTLFGAVALGLALRLTRGGELRLCPGCGEEFAPARRRDPNKRAWCPRCQYDKRKAIEARERRARRRAARPANNGRGE